MTAEFPEHFVIVAAESRDVAYKDTYPQNICICLLGSSPAHFLDKGRVVVRNKAYGIKDYTVKSAEIRQFVYILFDARIILEIKGYGYHRRKNGNIVSVFLTLGEDTLSKPLSVVRLGRGGNETYIFSAAHDYPSPE